MAVLLDKLKLKPHVKPQGRPKNSGKFWVLKTCKCQIDAVSKISEESQAKKLKLSRNCLNQRKNCLNQRPLKKYMKSRHTRILDR